MIDTDKTKALAGCMSIVPTFAALGNFANTALPTQFEKEETDVILTDAFQKSYAAHHKKAVDGGFMKNAWDKDSRRFDDYLSQAPLSMDERKALLKRFDMHHKLGNSHEFEGNGLTKQMPTLAPAKHQDHDPHRRYGVVETFNYERREMDLDKLVSAQAISVIRLV